MQIESLLKIEDIMRIFGLSRVSIYRRVSEARAGKSQFPLPIGKRKENLRWNATDIEAFCQSRTTSMPVVASPKQQRKKARANQEVVRATLEKHGIFDKSNQ